ncbi:EAL domain-containing protein [Xylophilus sp. Leaf220]|uniref:EAL domain-containing protein n=1 Tax=Xylophilus sp. Leaf220 TaxID=1735686 RepID=UPI0006F6BA02|nr:EAL domain-containing protein [Xylophilus sp. Leaf220]KQM78719.1 phosphodiesterase [Xylophilus sp. Leaf220]
MRLPRLRIHRLRTRIALIFTALVLVVQVLGYTSVSRFITSAARTNTDDQLQVAERVFGQIVQAHRERLAQAATVVAADFGFREAVATRNEATVVSALRNHGDRIQADLVMLIGLDGRLIADTTLQNSEQSLFLYPDLIARARREGSASSIAPLDDKLYELVVVPVRAPVTIAWIVMGFRVDSRVVDLLKSTTTLDVSFVSRTTAGHWQVLATSLPADTAARLTADLGDELRSTGRNTDLRLDGDDYAVRLVSLNRGDEPVVAVLQRSLAESMAPFQRVQSTLLLVSLAGLLVSVVAAILTARSVTRPIGVLSSFARGIGEGHYPPPIPMPPQEDELGDLARTFNRMRDGLLEREQRITGLAYEDALTHLPNRARFHEHLEKAIAQVQASKGNAQGSLAVMVMDLDRFKYVNDTLGHPIGDQLLVEVGRRLLSTLPGGDTVVARLGGDEFAVLLPCGDAASAFAIARQVLLVLEQPTTVEGQVVDIGASIGIVVCPQHGTDVPTLMRRADIAMYAAKRTGAGCLPYDSGHETVQPERLSLMGELRRAVEHGDLALHYQPKVDMASGEVHSVEALVRWEHATRGFVAPDRFIPFAEQTGYIKAITRFVAGSAIAQCAAWHAAGIEVAVSINVSARDLLGDELPALFAALLEEHRMEPGWIWIEVTESSVMDDPAHALATLNQLHDMGLRLSIDDFGTGYSSLAYLKRMPVDEIKIDKSFVMNMADDRDDEIIVRSTIDLGHNMGLKVVAEGVDNELVLQRLRALDCDMVQGYLLARPLSPKQFETWLTLWADKRKTLPIW